MKCKYIRVLSFTLLLVASIPLLTAAEAKQPDRSPGAYIPVLKNAHLDDLTSTRWVESAAGGYLEVLAGTGETWNALDQALTSMGIRPVKKDAESRQWLTDWVVWKYNKRKGTGRSKPAFSFNDSSLERHQFLFTVQPGNNRGHAVIMAVDSKREKEVDLTPDSEYSWLEWKPGSLQQGAADTFLQRLQLPVESALATEFVVIEESPRTTAGEPVVTQAPADARADVVLIAIPDTGGTAVPLPAPEPPPAISAALTREPPPAETGAGRQPVQAAPESVETAAPAGKTMPQQPPVPYPQPAEKPMHPPKPLDSRLAKSPQVTVPTQPQAMPVEVTRPPQAAEKSLVKEPPVAPAPARVAAAAPQVTTPVRTKGAVQQDAPVTPAANGLLVRAAPAVAWPALLRALRDLEIPIERQDREQYLLTTGWVNANYDRKNHQLVMRSKEGPKWAFSLFGKGIERQQYQVVMVPANQGAQSIIYAYNTGYQQQVDETPDSSQTLLAWEDRDTSPDVALAFLRKLRIILPQ